MSCQLSDTDLALVLCKPFIMWYIEDVMVKTMVLLVHKFASLCIGSCLAPLYARYQESRLPKTVAVCIVADFSMCICLPSRWDLAAVMARELA